MAVKRIDFSKYSSIRIGPEIDVELIEDDNWDKEGFTIIGGANNLLVSPAPPLLAVLSKEFSYCKLEDGFLKVGAATPGGRLVSFAKKHDLAGFEFAAKLPGTIGGMLAMNAGLKKYEIFNRLVEVKTSKGLFKKEEIRHGYRFARIPGVVFEGIFTVESGFDLSKLDLFEAMRSNQPAGASAGSCFKNPEGDYAGRLIEAVGLKGKRVGGMAFSDQHANFLMNLGGGTFEEAIELIAEAKRRVKEEFGIELEEEIRIL